MRHKEKHRETEMETERSNERKRDKEKGGEPKERTKYKMVGEKGKIRIFEIFQVFSCEFLYFGSTFCMFVSLCVYLCVCWQFSN